MAIVENAVVLFGLHFDNSKSVQAIVLFKHGSPDGFSIYFFHFAITASGS